MSLTKEEKSLVKDVFRKGQNKEKNYKVYNMTVARLYFGEQDTWQYSGHLGAAVIVSEYPKDSDTNASDESDADTPYASYICLVDLTSGAIIFTQEIYDEFMYVKAKSYFHHFETNMSVAGLSFASEEEALAFYNCVVEVTHKTLTEKEEKKRKAVIPVTRPAKPRTPRGGESFFDVVIVDEDEEKKKKKKKKRKFRKHKKGSKEKKEGGDDKEKEEAGDKDGKKEDGNGDKDGKKEDGNGDDGTEKKEKKEKRKKSK